MASEVILVIKGLHSVASTRLGYALCLAASLFNSLSERRRKEVVNRSWVSMNGLMGILNKDYPSYLGVLFKVILRVHWVPSLMWNNTLTFWHASPLDFAKRGHRHLWAPGYFKVPCAAKPCPRTEVAREKTADHSKTSLHSSAKIKATSCILRAWPNMKILPQHTPQPFQYQHFLWRNVF